VTDFDAREYLRLAGQAKALMILFKAAGKTDAAGAIALAERALSGIGHQVAISQPLPECPEAWLVGIHDIELALREAISLLSGVERR
jgi:hypothetical protein